MPDPWRVLVTQSDFYSPHLGGQVQHNTYTSPYEQCIRRTIRVAEVAREHGWHPPKSLDSDENLKPEHTLFCRELRFVAIYALFFLEIFGHKKCLFG